MENMNTTDVLVVSMACILQFGLHEENEVVQRALQHSAFLAYQRGEMDRSCAISAIAGKYKITGSLLESLLNEVPRHCQVDEYLLTALKSTGKRLVAWVDIPPQEWAQLRAAFPDSLWEIFTEFHRDVDPLLKDPNIVIIDRNVELASIHASHSLLALPYTEATKSRCIRYLRKLESVWHNLSTGKRQHVFDFFALFLAAICQPSILPQDVINNIRELVANRQPFGFFGTDFSRQPADIDDMSLCIAILFEMRSISSADANFFLDAARPRQDPVVVANVIYLAYLLNGGFVFGSIYYPQEESFLFHYGRVITKFRERIPNYNLMYRKIHSALINCIGNVDSKPLDIAKRLLLSPRFDIENTIDVELLLEMQNEDGSWPVQAIYMAYTTKGLLYNPVVDLAYVLKALNEAASRV